MLVDWVWTTLKRENGSLSCYRVVFAFELPVWTGVLKKKKKKKKKKEKKKKKKEKKASHS